MPDIAFLAARVMLSLFFILSGFAKLMAIAGIAGMLQRAGIPEPRLVGYAFGVFELVAGLMVLVGFMTRWASLALLVYTAILIFLAHAFWKLDGVQYAMQQTQALKNLAIMGGLLLLAFAGPGSLSIDARGRRASWR